MCNFKFISTIFLFGIVALIGRGSEGVCAENSSDVIIIVNNKAPDTVLSDLQIQKIFTGKETMWSSNEKIIVTVLKDDNIHETFLKKFVRRTETQFKNTWRRILFTGKGSTPREFSNTEEMINFISVNRLAIGYIPINELNDKVKAISN